MDREGYGLHMNCSLHDVGLHSIVMTTNTTTKRPRPSHIPHPPTLHIDSSDDDDEEDEEDVMHKRRTISIHRVAFSLSTWPTHLLIAILSFLTFAEWLYLVPTCTSWSSLLAPSCLPLRLRLHSHRHSSSSSSSSSPSSALLARDRPAIVQQPMYTQWTCLDLTPAGLASRPVWMLTPFDDASHYQQNELTVTSDAHLTLVLKILEQHSFPLVIKVNLGRLTISSSLLTAVKRSLPFLQHISLGFSSRSIIPISFLRFDWYEEIAGMFPNLVGLDIDVSNVPLSKLCSPKLLQRATSEELMRLANLLPHLKVFSVTSCREDYHEKKNVKVEEAMLEMPMRNEIRGLLLKFLPRLQELRADLVLSHIPLFDKVNVPTVLPLVHLVARGTKMVASLSQQRLLLPSLLSLDLSNLCDDSDYGNMWPIRSSVKCLQMSHSTSSNEDVLFTFIISFPNLVRLEIKNTPSIKTHKLRQLLAHLPRLRYFDFSLNPQCSNKCWTTLLKITRQLSHPFHPPDLRTLLLTKSIKDKHKNTLSSLELTSICALFPRLTTLDVSGHKSFNRAALQVVFNSLSELRHLYLACTGCTLACILALKQTSPFLPRLQSFHMSPEQLPELPASAIQQDKSLRLREKIRAATELLWMHTNYSVTLICIHAL